MCMMFFMFPKWELNYVGQTSSVIKEAGPHYTCHINSFVLKKSSNYMQKITISLRLEYTTPYNTYIYIYIYIYCIKVVNCIALAVVLIWKQQQQQQKSPPDTLLYELGWNLKKYQIPGLQNLQNIRRGGPAPHPQNQAHTDKPKQRKRWIKQCNLCG